MLYLLQFEDGKVVFEGDELKKVKNTVSTIVRKYGSPLAHSEAEFDTYSLELSGLKDRIDTNTIKILNADIGYYHHRFISHFTVKISHDDINGHLRMFRSALQDHSNGIVHECRNAINELSLRDRNKVLVAIPGFYHYQLIVVENSSAIHKTLQVPYSFQTTSLCFDIVKPSLIERKLLVRISIPCTIVYGHIQIDKQSDKTLVRDLINGIYQHALYGRKTRLSEMEPAKKAALNDQYKLDEQDLQSLWAYMIDTMGGKTSNLYAFKVFRLTLIVAIIAVVATIGPVLYDKAMNCLADNEARKLTTNADIPANPASSEGNKLLREGAVRPNVQSQPSSTKNK